MKVEITEEDGYDKDIRDLLQTTLDGLDVLSEKMDNLDQYIDRVAEAQSLRCSEEVGEGSCYNELRLVSTAPIESLMEKYGWSGQVWHEYGWKFAQCPIHKLKEA